MSEQIGQPDESFDLDLAAASIVGDSHDVAVLVKVLAGHLKEAFGDRLQVERKGGLLRKSEEVRALEVPVGKDQFRAELRGTGLVCTISRSSGGIRIRSEEVGVDEWVRRLLEALQEEAQCSQKARQALESIVIGGQP